MKFANTLATATFEAIRPNPLPEKNAVYIRCKVYMVEKVLSYDIAQSNRWATMFWRNILLTSPEEVSISHLQ
jgi:hypothetical protein